MLILEIATGIVLSVVVLKYWPVLLLVSLAITALLVAAGLVFWWVDALKADETWAAVVGTLVLIAVIPVAAVRGLRVLRADWQRTRARWDSEFPKSPPL